MLQFLPRILAVFAVALALPALAQSDPPARVGRLAFIENQVFFRVDRSDQGGPATLNWPVSSGAVLETGAHGRAEIWIGSTAYRLADGSQIEFSAVDDSRVDLRLNEGSLAVSILDRDQVDDLIVNTPDGDVRFLTPGRYRIDVFSDHSELSVQAGQAVFADGGRATPVAAGQKISRWSNGSERVDGDWDQDAFDQWVAQRENITLARLSRRYVSPQMTGYQDLDAYGDWQTAADYGAVWYPRSVAADWAPYRYGRWAWVAPWGWTWIDQSPWGFAPFHYGRWAIIHGRWGWVPGRHEVRPVYAPALVGWIGNSGWSVGFRSGTAPAVGWFPLAPREVYVPGHRYSHNYVRQINIGHIRDVNIIDRAERGGPREPFRNNALPRAVTVVPANLMREGRPITAAEIRHPERAELGRAPVARHAPNADWLAPAPAAARPAGEVRRDQPMRQPRREMEALQRKPMERGGPMPGSPDRQLVRPPVQESGNNREAEPRREIFRGSPEMRQGADNRGRPVEVAPLAPAVQLPRRDVAPQDLRQPAPEVAPAQQNDGRRGFSRRSGEAPAVTTPANPPVEAAPAPVQRREFFRRQGDPRGEEAMPARPPEAAPGRREMPAMEKRIDEPQPRPAIQAPPPAPAPMPRVEAPRQPMPQGGGMNEQRPDNAPQRQFLHQERPAQREAIAPPVIRQPEMPRPAPAPEVRAPAPAPVPMQRVEPQRQFLHQERPAQREAIAPPVIRQPEMPRPAPPPEVRAPAPVPAAPIPQQRAEPPRQPAPQSGGQNDPHRHRDKDDERGGR